MLYCFSYSIYIVYKWQTKDKTPQSSNVNAMNLSQNSRFSWNVFFSRKTIWNLLEFISIWTQAFTKIDQKKHKIEQICIWSLLMTGLMINININLHYQYSISVADTQTSPLAKCPKRRGARRNSCFRRPRLSVIVADAYINNWFSS